MEKEQISCKIGEDMPTEEYCCDDEQKAEKVVESNKDMRHIIDDLAYEYRSSITELYALKEYNNKIKNGIVKVSATQEKLLAEQETYMSGYVKVLSKRLNDLLGI